MRYHIVNRCDQAPHAHHLPEDDIVLLVSKARVSEAELYATDPFLIDSGELASLGEEFSLAALNAYGISPSEFLVRPNRDSVYLSVEMGQGVALGSSLSQTGELSITKIPTGKKDNLICVWLKESADPRIDVYAEFLRNYFQQDESAMGREHN